MTELTRYERVPKKAKVNRGEAWWYANRRVIELHVADGPLHFIVRLPLAQLREFVRRQGKP